VVNLSTGGTTNVDVPCNSAGPKGLSSSIADDVAAAFSGAPPTKGLGGCMALPEAEPVAVALPMAGVALFLGAGAVDFSEVPIETSDSFSFPFRVCPSLSIICRG